MCFQALLDYERHKTSGGELSVIVANPAETMNIDSQVNMIRGFSL